MTDVAVLDDVLFQPSPPASARAQLRSFIKEFERRTDRKFVNYADFDTCAVDEFRVFWQLFLEWSSIISEGACTPVCDRDDCETAIFFPDLKLNYAENLLRGGAGQALVGCHADGSRDVVLRHELRDKVIRFAIFLRGLGVESGDRVVAIARNNVEAIIVALATAAIGAVFSSCAHDMGVLTVLSRFQQLSPKVLIGNCASRSWDTGKPLAERLAEIISGLPSLTDVVVLDGTLTTLLPMHRFADALAIDPTGFVWQRFQFNHPLFILFSSGTTGMPKCIVHGAGGTLLEHMKEHRLHGDLDQHDRMFFQTSCGWMMWNWQLSALACGAQIVTYDGPLKGPDTLWKIVADERVSVFGTNPAYLQFCETVGYSPNVLDLSNLRSVLSTGSILYPKQFDWIAEHAKRVAVQSISGGTDILGCFVLGNPLLPVHRGQAQCRSIGLDVRSLSEEGSIGELICANPFPSRPTGFYGEPDARRYHQAYFAQNPGVWTHGDLIEFTQHGAIMHGRSDGVMNIRGVRIGPAEIYRILQQIPTIIEAMAVEQVDEAEAGGARLVLLVVLRGGVTLDSELIMRIRRLLAEQGNTTMVPASIIQMSELPVTHSGKRSEAAARDAVNGRPIANRSALLNPECLDQLSREVKKPSADAGLISDNLEERLCAICQKYLGVPIQPSDDFLTAGCDSIVILSFLMEVVECTETSTPLQTLVGVSTIAELTKLLQTASPNNGETMAAVQLIQLDQGHRLLYEAFLDRWIKERLRETWKQETPYEFYTKEVIQWRYFDRNDDNPVTWLAMEEDRCVGMLDSMERPYLLDGKQISVCETADWYCVPDRRPYGIGLRLLYHVMHLEAPIFITSGTPSALAIFSKMRGWMLLSATTFAMPLTARGLAAKWVRHKVATTGVCACSVPFLMPYLSRYRERLGHHLLVSLREK